MNPVYSQSESNWRRDMEHHMADFGRLDPIPATVHLLDGEYRRLSSYSPYATANKVVIPRNIHEYLERKGPIIFASTSQRRRGLLERADLGRYVEFGASEFEENINPTGMTPKEYCTNTALGKCLWKFFEGCESPGGSKCIITCDTVVVKGSKSSIDTPMENPADVLREKPTRGPNNTQLSGEEAKRSHCAMLDDMMSSKHTIVSVMIYITEDGQVITRADATEVTPSKNALGENYSGEEVYKSMPDEARTESLGMAGGLPHHHHSVQVFIKSVVGYLDNMIGLAVKEFARLPLEGDQIAEYPHETDCGLNDVLNIFNGFTTFHVSHIFSKESTFPKLWQKDLLEGYDVWKTSQKQ